MRKCPFCAEEIQEEAIKCRHCHERLDTDAARWTAYAAKYSAAKPPEQWKLWRRLDRDQRAYLTRWFHLTPPDDQWSQTANRLVAASPRAKARMWNSLNPEHQEYLKKEYGLQAPVRSPRKIVSSPVLLNLPRAGSKRQSKYKRVAIGLVLFAAVALVSVLAVLDFGPEAEEGSSVKSTEAKEVVEQPLESPAKEPEKAKPPQQRITANTGTLNNTVGNFENAEYAEIFGLEKMHQWSSDTSVAYQGKLTTVVTLLIDSNGDIVKERLGWLVLPEGEDLFLSIVTFCSQAIGATRAEEERMLDEVSDIFAATLEKRPTDTSFKIRGYTISLGVLKLDGQRSDQFVVEVTPG